MSSVDSHTSYYQYHVHPAPPPTVNRLTARQKAQLRRTTTKLTKVLGAAPQVVDELPASHTGRIISPPKKLQPSLSITSSSDAGTGRAHRRARSATASSGHVGRIVDPELYPLSSAPRPASYDICRPRRSSSSNSRRSSISNGNSRRSRSMSISSDCTFLSLEDSDVENADADEKSSLVVVRPRTRPRPRPRKEMEEIVQPRPESTTFSTKSIRDSLCDSLYEPTFSIPSATKLRREKMARVQKLLGEDVPVELVFPIHAEDDLLSSPLPNPVPSPTKVQSAHALGLEHGSGKSGVLDITRAKEEDGAEIDKNIDIDASSVPPPTPPKFEVKRKPVPALSLDLSLPTTPEVAVAGPKPEHLQQQQMSLPRWATYCASRPNLETIAEQSSTSSPRDSRLSAGSSLSIMSSASSAGSLLSSTTSSSYRFTSSSALGCVSVSASSGSEGSDSDCSSSSASSASPSTPTTSLSERISEMYNNSPGTQGRREFAIYVPFRRTRAIGNCQAEYASINNSIHHAKDPVLQEFGPGNELVRGMLDLRV